MRRLFLCFLLLGLSVAAHSAPQFLDDDAERACDVSFELQKAATGRFTLSFDFQDARNTYLLEATPTAASFVRLQDGTRCALASTPVAWKPQSTLTLQRRPWMMRLLVEGRVVLTAFDATWSAGKIGAEMTGWTWKDTRVQPVETIRFDDDFTRAGQEGDNGWKVGNGTWALTASSERINAHNANMSSNPFAYVVSNAQSGAFTSTGRRFWDSYDARVAARPEGKGAIGIAAYVQDSKNYYAFVWSGTEGATSRRLIKVQNGTTTVLTSASGAFLPRQWYEIGLRTSPGYIEALLDGAPILRARDDSFGQGGIGLLAQNLQAAAFDDVRVRSYDFYRQNVGESNGSWKTLGDFRLTGRFDGDGYRFIAPLKGTPGAAFGLVTGLRDAKNYTLFRAADAKSSAPFKGRQQIVRYDKGVATVLSDQPIAPELSGTPRLLLNAQNGALNLSVGEKVIAQAAAPGLTKGQTGLWMPAAFGTDTVLYFPPTPDPPKVADSMVDDAYMVGWASPTGEWPPTPGDSGLEFWNTGEFFGDSSLEFPWRGTYKGSLEVALRAQRGQFNSGYLLRGESTDDRKSVKWTLSRGGKTLASSQVALVASPDDDTQSGLVFKVAMQGNSILLLAGDQPVLSALDATPPAGYAMAVRSQGFRVRAERLHALSLNRDDYTFTGAPTDFYAPQGHWSIFSRWPCYGDWSFFGGEGLSPVLWSKRSYGGDIVSEMYAHPQMILPKEPGYAHPGDLNMTLCGDGKNPSSGYSFVVAGWDNTRSRILKGTQVLAENTGTEAYFQETTNHNTKWHRKWFYIRAEARQAVKDGKTGVQLTLTLDDSPIVTVFDPNPLPTWKEGGRVAFWTVDSTLMIARAKIESAKMGLKALPTGLMDSMPQPVLAATGSATTLKPVAVNNGDNASVIVSADKGGWTLADPASGGPFEARLNAAPLQATPATRLQFDAEIPAGVKIDTYCVIDGQRYTLEMTGEQKPDALAPSLGKMTRSAPNTAGLSKWSFDLGAALQKRFPDRKSWPIESLSLGARHGDNYRWLGFDGNAMGSRYKIANLQWG